MSDGTADGDDPRALRAVAEQLATEAAAFVRRRRGEVFGPAAAATADDAVAVKSTPTDPVTVVDTETERLLRERLAELRPGDQILGEEEGGTADAAAGQLTWVLDPIDGTVNFVYDIWAYAVSVAVQRDGESVAGAVADVANGVVYSAARGDGASVTAGGAATPLRCSAAGDLSLALLGTGFAYAPQRRREQAEILLGVLPHVRDVRRIGSCALDLCMVAAGRLDVYYEDGVNVWDWAAGALIAAEAGARVRLPVPAGAVGGDGLVTAAAPGVADAFEDLLGRVGVR
ncbi:inositol monophosphatase family protein [Mycolicibacterium sp. F2034L]|uniref:inositol monophosphatase family protein n=1 Tax=Mycolicibacterium sp. F2034L TaxID=2926422 RepID=UPI001FF22220|nr:inositol monophosphatase family protein [Mycolicibacterium sp. F2034L]MCK0177532.1 inositol monophosphatase [Mycolicibacterium sp. F2034L]